MKILQAPTGNTAEDEQNNKRNAKRYRVYLIILAVWLAFLLVLVTILVPMLVIQKQDSEAEAWNHNIEATLANNYTTQFRDAVLGAISAAYGLEGYIMGEMQALPPLNGTIAERTQGQRFDGFYHYAELLASTSPKTIIFLTAPGAVTLQVYPPDLEAELEGRDLLNDSTASHQGSLSRSDADVDWVNPWVTIDTGIMTLMGPYESTGVPFAKRNAVLSMSDDRWWVALRQPVYNASLHVNVSSRTFWGFAIVTLSVDALIRMLELPATMEASEMSYVVYTESNSTPSTCCIIIASSDLAGTADCNAPLLRSFLADATTRDVLKEQLSWKIAVKSTQRTNRLTSSVRNAIVIASVMGVLTLFIASILVILRCTRVYDGAVYAPKAAPFAMLTIGPCRGDELWDLAADQMVEVTEQLGLVLAREMVRHHAYQIQQVHPLTTSYVTRSVASAVQMAFDIIEDLQSNPIDGPMRRLLGDEGSLLMSYALHWCTDAVVRTDLKEGGYRYEGPDIVYGGRMWVFAGPNVVTASPAALPHATRMPHVKSKLFDSVFLRGVTTRQDLYVITDRTNPRLKEAESFALQQMRLARQAQLQNAAEQETEGGSSSNYSPKERLLTAFPRTGYDGSEVNSASSFYVRAASASGVSAAPFSHHPHPPNSSNSQPGSRSHSDGSHSVSGTFLSSARKEKALGGGVLPTSVLVPAFSLDIPPSSAPMAAAAAVGIVDGPFIITGPPLPESQRRMVSRPRRPHARSRTPSTSSASGSTSGHDVVVEKEQGASAAPPQAPGGAHGQTFDSKGGETLHHAASSTTATSSGGVKIRRGPHNSHGAALPTVSSGPSGTNSSSMVRYPDLLPSNPFVVVPPSATVMAAAHGLNSSSAASPLTAIAEEANYNRRGNLVSNIAYDNPLASSAITPAKSGTPNAGSMGVQINAPAAGGGGTATVAGGKADRVGMAEVSRANHPSSGEERGTLPSSTTILDSLSNDLLLRPAISAHSDELLRTIFDRQAVALDVSYDSVRVLVYYFYSSYKILFRPLAAPELHNIYRRLMAAFGVPQQGILEHLAARCAIRFLQRHDETQTLLWDQQHRLKAHSHGMGAQAANVTSASTFSEETATHSSAEHAGPSPARH